MNIFVAINELDLDPDDRQEVEPILLKYEIEVDSALVRRREALDKYQDVLKDAMISKDTDTGLDALRKICDKRAEICRLHMGTINDLDATLPEDAAGQFRISILRSGFPTIYAETRVDKLLKAVRAMDDLTDDQVEQLDAIESAYEASLQSANEMLLETYLIHGKEMPIIEVKRAIRRETGSRSTWRSSPRRSSASSRPRTRCWPTIGDRSWRFSARAAEHPPSFREQPHFKRIAARQERQFEVGPHPDHAGEQGEVEGRQVHEESVGPLDARLLAEPRQDEAGKLTHALSEEPRRP